MSKILKKILIKPLFLLCFVLHASFSFASDFIAPNSGGEPILIDVSNLNLLSSPSVSIGEFGAQPRPYRDENTKTFVIFPPPVSNGEKTIQIQAGSSNVTKTVSFRPSPSGSLKASSLPSLHESRGGNTITKISDGRIVLIGGSKSLAENPLDSIEIFSPETGNIDFLKTPNGLKNLKLQLPRSQHAATYIGISEKPLGMITGPVEQILIIGGFSKNGALENSIEILEIKIGTNESTTTLLSSKKAKLKKGRVFHTASLLPDGRVLIIGGQGSINKTNLGALSSIEIFDPLTRQIQSSPISLNTPRLLHTATTLQNGNILISGGFTNEKQSAFGIGPGTSVCELINTSNLTIKKVSSLINNKGLGGHAATLLTNGLVLITGGNSDFFSSVDKEDILKGVSSGTVQFYNPANESFNIVNNKISGGSLELEIPRFLHGSVLLPNGVVAVIGGQNIKANPLNTSTLISTPVSEIEILEPDLLGFSGSSLPGIKKTTLKTFLGRIQPSAILVTPKNKIQGFLSSSDINKFVNCAIFLSGGFTNGFGKLPTKVSELIQIDTNSIVEGRQIKPSPQAVIQGSYLGELLISIDEFSKIPSLRINPQTVNLSASNNFMASVKVFSTNDEVVLLKAQNTDPNNSIVVSPSLFQLGEEVSITRKDSSVQGEFEITFLPADPSFDFVEGKLKVNVSDSAKPFLGTVPGYGLSLGNLGESSLENIQVKVFSQDGLTELSSISPTTSITATVSDPQVLNLGGTGISSVSGTLQTQFMAGAIKPGKTNINFSTTFPDVLGVSIPVRVTGTPVFLNTPIDSTILSSLSNNGLELSMATKVNDTTVSLQDVRLLSNTSLFPLYIPINLQSSIDNSSITGTFSIRPLFGIDLLTSNPRMLVNKTGAEFRESLSLPSIAVGGIVPTSPSLQPLAVLTFDDDIKSLTYDGDVNKNLTEQLNKINGIGGVKDLKLLELQDKIKIVGLMGSMLLLLDAESGDVESTTELSENGFELELTKIKNDIAAVITLGNKGIDLVFPIADAMPRVINFNLPGNTKHISIVEKLGSTLGPFAITYDGLSSISIVNLGDLNAPIQTIKVGQEKISNLDYAGRYSVGGKVIDVLIAATQRKILLFDLNNLTSITVNEDQKIKNQIEDLLVVDGIAYLALGEGGISAISIGSLIDNNDKTEAEIAHFVKSKLNVVKPNGKLTVLSKPLNAKKLASSKPFLLSIGEGNDLTVIKVSP